MDHPEIDRQLTSALRQIYDRSPVPEPLLEGGNLPWNEPAFSERMLAQHLDQSHSAASRQMREILAQMQPMLDWLNLSPGSRLFDVTCGPGLYAAEFAKRGIEVTGIDFGPASIAYARQHCRGLPCEFTLGDVREMDFAGRAFDAAIYLYGQFAVLAPDDAGQVLRRVYDALRPGGRVLLEILDFRRYDKKNDSWWYTDQGGLWGDFPFLHLGQRVWYDELQVSVERYHILNLENGTVKVYALSDQAYRVSQMRRRLMTAGFTDTRTHPAWDGLPLKDAHEWIVYVAQKAES
jgi:SAM-dependent methyltransferase